jgi:uncharacterized coiled-coil protein SlyX
VVEERRIIEARAYVDARISTAAAATGTAIGKARKQLRDEVIALADEIGDHCAGLERRIKEQEKRIAGLEGTVTELLAALERKVEDLEQRAVLRTVKPRLIAGRGSDGAA